MDRADNHEVVSMLKFLHRDESCGLTYQLAATVVLIRRVGASVYKHVKKQPR